MTTENINIVYKNRMVVVRKKKGKGGASWLNKVSGLVVGGNETSGAESIMSRCETNGTLIKFFKF